MDKIKLIYNITLIANIKDAHWARSGVFFAAACLLKEFARRDDIELVLYYETEDKELASKNVKYWCKKELQSIVKYTLKTPQETAVAPKTNKMAALCKKIIKKIIGENTVKTIKNFIKETRTCTTFIMKIADFRPSFFQVSFHPPRKRVLLLHNLMKRSSNACHCCCDHGGSNSRNNVACHQELVVVFCVKAL